MCVYRTYVPVPGQRHYRCTHRTMGDDRTRYIDHQDHLEQILILHPPRLRRLDGNVNEPHLAADAQRVQDVKGIVSGDPPLSAFSSRSGTATLVPGFRSARQAPRRTVAISRTPAPSPACSRRSSCNEPPPTRSTRPTCSSTPATSSSWPGSCSQSPTRAAVVTRLVSPWSPVDFARALRETGRVSRRCC